MKPQRAIFALMTVAMLVTKATTFAADRADPIAPPEDRSTLPAVRQGVVMVKAQKDGRLNVQLGGWGGMRLIQAKTDPGSI